MKPFMEHAGESDAYSFITNKQRLCLREADACQLVNDVLTALRYLHSQVGAVAMQRLWSVVQHIHCVPGCKQQ